MKKFLVIMLAMLWMSVAAFSQITISQEDYDKLPSDTRTQIEKITTEKAIKGEIKEVSEYANLGKEIGVAVKTTQYLSKSGNYEVLLKNCGGSSGQSKIRHFDNSTCDILFIVVVNGDMYEIPSSEITVKSTLTLTDKWDKYKVSL